MFDFLKRFATPAQLREAGVLGMNRRNYEIIAKSNDRRLYPLVDDKVQTKKLAAGAASDRRDRRAKRGGQFFVAGRGL